MKKKRIRVGVEIAALFLLIAGSLQLHAEEKPAALAFNAASIVEQKGVRIEFTARPVGKSPQDVSILVGDDVDVSFRLTDAPSGQPLSGKSPGAWLDTASSAIFSEKKSCKEKVSTYLKGTPSVRPLIDLTTYHILAFNRDASISVIDPLVGIAGKTNLFATIVLSSPPGDWTKSRDGKRLFVTMPAAGQVAVIDTESYKVLENIDVGAKPVRVALSPDGGHLWIADDGETDDAGGLTAVDAATLKVVAHIPTGKGHHEIAFSEAGDFLFVTNRDKGDVFVIDAARRTADRRISTGSMPISLAYSKLAQALYVADGIDGTITVVDGRDRHIISRVNAKPGLGPIAITPDERWALVLNTKENLVHVIEIATNQVTQNIPIGWRPFQISFSEAFAYVRSLDSEIVGMISTKALGKPEALQISTFSAGATPPVNAPDLGIGASIARAVGEAAVLVANPADNQIYYYMEGMLAPSGSFRNPGRFVSAVGVVDRTLKEAERGSYSARVRIPAAGAYDVAFLLEAPSLVECFRLHAAAAGDDNSKPSIDYLQVPAVAKAGEVVTWRFRLVGGKSGEQKTRVEDVRVLYFGPGAKRREAPADEIGDGVYEAKLKVDGVGAYYIYVGAPSLGIHYAELPPRNLLVREVP